MPCKDRNNQPIQYGDIVVYDASWRYEDISVVVTNPNKRSRNWIEGRVIRRSGRSPGVEVTKHSSNAPAFWPTCELGKVYDLSASKGENCAWARIGGADWWDIWREDT